MFILHVQTFAISHGGHPVFITSCLNLSVNWYEILFECQSQSQFKLPMFHSVSIDNRFYIFILIPNVFLITFVCMIVSIFCYVLFGFTNHNSLN